MESSQVLGSFDWRLESGHHDRQRRRHVSVTDILEGESRAVVAASGHSQSQAVLLTLHEQARSFEEVDDKHVWGLPDSKAQSQALAALATAGEERRRHACAPPVKRTHIVRSWGKLAVHLQKIVIAQAQRLLTRVGRVKCFNG